VSKRHDGGRSVLGVLARALGSAALFFGLISLGLWQLDRAAEKRARSDEYAERFAATPIDIGAWNAYSLDEVRWRRVTASGRFSSPALLLDNRTHSGSVGFEVLAPFILDDGRTVLVDRGWVAADPDRNKLPTLETPEPRLTLSGHIGPPPVTGLKFNAQAETIETLAPGLARLQNVDPAQIASAFNLVLEPGVIYLAEDSPAGYVRAWPPPGDDSERHRAYAVQWFAMAGIFLIILISAKFRRSKREQG